MSPFNAFLFIQGLETLPLRMREHCRNAAGGRALSAERTRRSTRVIHPALHDRRASAARRDLSARAASAAWSASS